MKSEVGYENGRLIVTRLFNAPREAVFNAWIETSKVQLWWGCNVAEEVKSDIEPKRGGNFSHSMTLNNGFDYLIRGLITEFEPPAILAYEMVDSFQNRTMQVRVEFTDEGTQTKVRLTQDNLPDENSEFVIAGWSAGFDKLAELLVQEAAL